MTPAWVPPQSVAPFVMERAGLARDFGECRALGVFNKSGQMVAGVVFHNWCPESGVIEVSAASDDPKWATRTVLRFAFDYVFSFAQLCAARTHENNQRTRRLWKAMGAQEFILPRMRGREASEAVLLLTDDAWYASPFASPRVVAETKAKSSAA